MLDSLPNTNLNKMQDVVSELRKYLQRSHGIDISKFSEKQPLVKRQKNNCDCGYHVLLYIQDFGGDEILKINEDKVMTFRKKLAMDLLYHPENKKRSACASSSKSKCDINDDKDDGDSIHMYSEDRTPRDKLQTKDEAADGENNKKNEDSVRDSDQGMGKDMTSHELIVPSDKGWEFMRGVITYYRHNEGVMNDRAKKLFLGPLQCEDENKATCLSKDLPDFPRHANTRAATSQKPLMNQTIFLPVSYLGNGLDTVSILQNQKRLKIRIPRSMLYIAQIQSLKTTKYRIWVYISRKHLMKL
ncbi:hypothetical protein BS78_04G097800 [Paspalum vaginatum]|nr:hypothetical protein BS78_04G097800 [Paspalum vaginatum]